MLKNEYSYWNKNFAAQENHNSILLDWFSFKRWKLFEADNSRFSLEIGGGIGAFSSHANVDVAVDISKTALEQLGQRHPCILVVADAANLPFKDECFDDVFVNDVMHHLKADGNLQSACGEMRRVLRIEGALYVSDRRPGFYNWLILSITALGRPVLFFLARLLSKRVLMSGGSEEPPMTEIDWAEIRSDMHLVQEKYWRHWLWFWLYGFYQFLAIILPKQTSCMVATKLTKLFSRLEVIGGASSKTDLCLTLRKVKNI